MHFYHFTTEAVTYNILYFDENKITKNEGNALNYYKLVTQNKQQFNFVDQLKTEHF